MRCRRPFLSLSPRMGTLEVQVCVQGPRSGKRGPHTSFHIRNLGKGQLCKDSELAWSPESSDWGQGWVGGRLEASGTLVREGELVWPRHWATKRLNETRALCSVLFFYGVVCYMLWLRSCSNTWHFTPRGESVIILVFVSCLSVSSFELCHLWDATFSKIV